MITTKKGMELPSQKMVLLALLAITLIIVLFSNDISFFSKSAIYEQTKKSCEFEEGTILGDSSKQCNPINCDVDECNDDESDRWEVLKTGFMETSCYDDIEQCETAFENTMHNMVVEGESNSIDLAELEEYSLSQSEFSQKLSSYEAAQEDDFEIIVKELSDELELNYYAVRALVRQETGEDISEIEVIDSSSQYPILRFECHYFNGDEYVDRIGNDYCSESRKMWLNQDSVQCTIEEGDLFSRVSEETGVEAFKEAKEMNSDLAICSTSFGAFQIMGFNAEALGFSGEDKYENFLAEMYTAEGQVKLFFKFLNYRNLLGEFQSENPNWALIAQKYNGAGYEENDYDKKLAQYYQEYNQGSALG